MPVVNSETCQVILDNVNHTPAAIVSPPRRIRILPMSLLAAKVSSGIARTGDTGPDNVPVLRVICTSADMLLVSTLFRFVHQNYTMTEDMCY